MPEFDKNAAFIWAIVALGVALPVLLGVYASVRAGLAKRRLERLQREDGDLPLAHPPKR